MTSCCALPGRVQTPQESADKYALFSLIILGLAQNGTNQPYPIQLVVYCCL